MKVLVICDDFYHPGVIVKEGLSFLNDQIEITYAEDMSKFDMLNFDFNGKSLSDFDAVIIAKDNEISSLNKDGWLNDGIEQKFLEYVENGGGLLFLHAGSVICKRSQVLREIAGCEFMQHPDECIVEFNVKGDHEISLGAESFSEKDEHYFLNFYAEDADIFLHSQSENGVQPAGYTRLHKNGHVCVLTPGHNLPVWKNEQFMHLLKSAVYWCAGKSAAI